MKILPEPHRPEPEKFICSDQKVAIERLAEHGGSGPILFRRLATACAFESGIDFIDLTIVPPGSIIGSHEHVGTEELYFITAGTALVTVGGEQRRVRRGDVTIVRSYQSHELINDSIEPVEILVVQVRV